MSNRCCRSERHVRPHAGQGSYVSAVMEAMPTPDISVYQCASERKRQARSSMCASVSIQSPIKIQGLRNVPRKAQRRPRDTGDNRRCIVVVLAFL